jgi:hypothetical protein
MPKSVLGNQGVLLPSDTTANRPTSGDEFGNGCIRYNTSLNKVEGYINSGWKTFLTSDDVDLGLSRFYEDANGYLWHEFNSLSTNYSTNGIVDEYEMVFFDNGATSYNIDSNGQWDITQ